MLNKLLFIGLFVFLPYTAFASLTLSPSTGSTLGDIIVTSCSSCVDGSGYTVAYLYDSGGTWLTKGNFIVNLLGGLPETLISTDFVTNGVPTDPDSIGFASLADGTYKIAFSPYAGGIYVASCESGYDTCIASGLGQGGSFTLTSGGGGSGISTSTLFASTTASQVTYHDWIYVNGFIIFLLSFIPVGFIYSIFKKK